MNDRGVQNAQMQGPKTVPGDLDIRDAHWSILAEGGGMSRDGLTRV